MPVSLRSLQDETRSLTMPVGTETLSFKYRPNFFTPAFEEELDRSENQSSAGKSLLKMLVPLIAEWDLQDEKGKTLPITEDVLRDIPITFLSNVAEAIGKDINPQKASSGPSENSW